MTELQQKARQLLSEAYNDSEAFPRPESMTITMFNTLCALSSADKPISINEMAESLASSMQTTMRRSLNELAYALAHLNSGLELKRMRPEGRGKAYYYWIQ